MNKYFNEAHTSIVTLNKEEIEAPVGNIYKAITIIAKRSDQIMEDLKMELLGKLEEFSVPTADVNLEEIFDNKEQIDISRYYESLPKAHAVALEEWLNGKIYYRETSEETPLHVEE